MHWILADLLMFICSVGVYLAVRKAALSKMPPQFNNLAMFAIPLAIFVLAAVLSDVRLNLTLTQAAQVLFTGVVLSYYGNAMSMRSVELAPNAGYSLVVSKSYVALTAVLAVPLFHARLTIQAAIAIAVIIASSAFIMINPKTAGEKAKSSAWVPLALGAFLCWAFLSLMSKHFTSEGVPTITFLLYVFLVATICILLEMKHKHIALEVIRRKFLPFTVIGLAATGFNYFNFYAISIAPNVGYINATNAASIGAVTLVSVILFKDELTVQKLLGVVGVILGLLLLFIWH